MRSGVHPPSVGAAELFSMALFYKQCFSLNMLELNISIRKEEKGTPL